MSETALKLCEKAWKGQDGYVFLSVRNPENRRWKDLPFKWPEDKEAIRATLAKAEDARNDVYWAPAVYRKPSRAKTAVRPTRILWADLDTADPRNLPDGLKPSAVWESSPGRYQALWTLPYRLHPLEHDEFNKRLTYAVGADRGGWDLTQVLRIPDTPNHKYEDKPKVHVLWSNGHITDPLQIAKLPEVPASVINHDIAEDLPDARKVLHKHRRNIRPKTMSLLKATHAPKGRRSEILWGLMVGLAEAGLNREEILSLAQASVWNKFRGRHDEMQRLTIECEKAMERAEATSTSNGAATVVTTSNGEEESHDLEPPVSWKEFDEDRRPISWMVADVWGEGEVGFVSGLPKSYKSWITLDLAVSVAVGGRFLGAFSSKRHNVLLIQAEDPKSVIQDRLSKVGAAKGLIWVKSNGNAIEFRYDLPDNLYIMAGQMFNITSEEDMEALENWIKERDIRLVVLDPLMMMAEGVDEFKAFEMMSKALKPLKRLRARTQCSILVVHHHTKTDKAGSGGQAMYGSVALWAWEEAGLHLSVSGVRRISAERFSKHSMLPSVNIDIGDTDKRWNPTVSTGSSESGLMDLLIANENGYTIDELKEVTGLGRDALTRYLNQLIKAQKVVKGKGDIGGKGRRKVRFRLKSYVPEEVG
jgi:AAA domain/RepB DNA-primase N-terminal domain